MTKPFVAILMGSDSDLDTMQATVEVLDKLGVAREVNVLSAHRTPDATRAYVQEADGRGCAVFIAAAGMAAHLPGAVAAWTALPVIGVPIGKPGMSGLDALLSIAQMPPGVPVACMAVNGAKNAALLAAAILALKHEPVRRALQDYRRKQAEG